MAAVGEYGLLRTNVKCLFNNISQIKMLSCFFRTKFTHDYPRYMSVFTTSRPEKSKSEPAAVDDETVFRSLNLRGDAHSDKKTEKKRVTRATYTALPPRYTKMPIDQDWPSVWPTAQSFKASVVPLPLRQGYRKKGDAPPGKYGNVELMKIPNFLHLTPPAIKRHCEAIQKFCTPWPKELTDDETCEKHFPVSIITNDYLQSGPSIREPKARIVTMKLKLSSLELNAHAKDKLIRLVGNRFDPVTGDVTIVTDRCPLKKQNYDYAVYLLTAVFFESWKTEPWESEKDEEDAECYDWNKSRSKTKTLSLLKTVLEKCKDQPPTPLNGLSVQPEESDILKLEEVVSYSKAVTQLHNEGEDLQSLKDYKESVLKLLDLKSISTGC